MADRAAIALNVACASAGLETSDPTLLIRCDAATREARRALREGACAKPIEEHER